MAPAGGGAGPISTDDHDDGPAPTNVTRRLIRAIRERAFFFPHEAISISRGAADPGGNAGLEARRLSRDNRAPNVVRTGV